MDCEKLLELLSEYIDGRLSVEESAAVAAHLEDCLECREFEKELRATVRLVGDLDHCAAPESFADGVAAALERKMLLDGPLARRGGRRWLPWSFAGLSLAAAAAVLAVVLVGGPLQRARMSPAEPAGTGVSVAKHADEIGEDLLEGEALSERAVELKVIEEREELSERRAEVGKLTPVAEDDATHAWHFSRSRRATDGVSADFSWDPLEVPDETVEPPLKRGRRMEVARESRAAGTDYLAHEARVSERLADKDEKALRLKLEDAAKIESPVAGERDDGTLEGLGYAFGGSGGQDRTAAPAETGGVEQQGASPVEVAAAFQASKFKETQTIPQIEFYSAESAIQATVLFANNFLARESQMAPAESTPEELKKRLTELHFQVIEMSDARTVLQMELEPIAILSNNELLVQNTSLSLTQSGVTPREITSQVSIETQNAIANQAPVPPGARGKPLAVQYVFNQRLPRENADAPPEEAPAEE